MQHSEFSRDKRAIGTGHQIEMTKDRSDNCGKEPLAERREKGDSGSKRDPRWTDGLRRIYDSVLEEDLPDSFNDLLSKLDDNGKTG